MLLNTRLLICSLINELPCARQAGLKGTPLSLILWVWAAVVMLTTMTALPPNPDSPGLQEGGILVVLASWLSAEEDSGCQGIKLEQFWC